MTVNENQSFSKLYIKVLPVVQFFIYRNQNILDLYQEKIYQGLQML
jgi:hypothetical protein